MNKISYYKDLVQDVAEVLCLYLHYLKFNLHYLKFNFLNK